MFKLLVQREPKDSYGLGVVLIDPAALNTYLTSQSVCKGKKCVDEYLMVDSLSHKPDNLTSTKREFGATIWIGSVEVRALRTIVCDLAVSAFSGNFVEGAPNFVQ